MYYKKFENLNKINLDDYITNFKDFKLDNTLWDNFIKNYYTTSNYYNMREYFMYSLLIKSFRYLTLS